MSTDDEFIHKLERRRPDEIRDALAQGIYSETRARIARSYLDRLDKAREDERRNAEVSATQDANEIARDANKLAAQANRIAIGSALVALVALIVSIVAIAYKAS